MSKITEFMRDEEGATAIEYALIVAAIALVIYSAASGVGSALITFFGKVTSSLSSAGSAG